MPGAQQPARCRRPDTGREVRVVPFALVLSRAESVAQPAGRSRASPETGYPTVATKKLIPFTGSRVSPQHGENVILTQEHILFAI